MKDLGYGSGYAYDHEAPDRFSGQDYFPDGISRETYYRPTGEGEEALVRQRLETWAKLRAAREPGP
jgi:putative ATPase